MNVRKDQKFHGAIVLGTAFFPGRAHLPGHARQSVNCVDLAGMTVPAELASLERSGGAGLGEGEKHRVMDFGQSMRDLMISRKNPYVRRDPQHRGYHLLRAAVLANPIAILIPGIIGWAGGLSRVLAWRFRAIHCFKLPSLAKSSPTLEALRRSDSAMLVRPMVRRKPMVALRKAAMTWGPVPLRIRLASSPIVTSRT